METLSNENLILLAFLSGMIIGSCATIILGSVLKTIISNKAKLSGITMRFYRRIKDDAVAVNDCSEILKISRPTLANTTNCLVNETISFSGPTVTLYDHPPTPRRCDNSDKKIPVKKNECLATAAANEEKEEDDYMTMTKPVTTHTYQNDSSLFAAGITTAAEADVKKEKNMGEARHIYESIPPALPPIEEGTEIRLHPTPPPTPPTATDAAGATNDFLQRWFSV